MADSLYLYLKAGILGGLTKYEEEAKKEILPSLISLEQSLAETEAEKKKVSKKWTKQVETWEEELEKQKKEIERRE